MPPKSRGFKAVEGLPGAARLGTGPPLGPPPQGSCHAPGWLTWLVPAFQVPGEVFLPVSAGVLAARPAGALLPKSSQGESQAGAPSSTLGMLEVVCPLALGKASFGRGRVKRGKRLMRLSAPARRRSPASCGASRSTWCTSPARTSSSESAASASRPVPRMGLSRSFCCASHPGSLSGVGGLKGIDLLTAGH